MIARGLNEFQAAEMILCGCKVLNEYGVVETIMRGCKGLNVM